MDLFIPFNSIDGDRTHWAEDLAEMIKSVMTNGVHPNPGDSFFVSPAGGWNLNLYPGRTVIEGRLGSNKGMKTLTVAVPHATLDRIDSVVLRLDYPMRMIYEYVKSGTPSNTPVAPLLQRDTVAYEIGVANILLNSHATGISQAMVSDTRHDNSRCGIINSLIRVDASSLFAQYDAVWREWIERYQASSNGQFNDFVITLNEMRMNFQAFINGFTDDFQSQHDQYEQDITDMSAQFQGNINNYSSLATNRFNTFVGELDSFTTNAFGNFTSWNDNFQTHWQDILTDWFENFISNLSPEEGVGIMNQLFLHEQKKASDEGGVHGIRYVHGAFLVQTDIGWIVVARPTIGLSWNYIDALEISWDEVDALLLTWDELENKMETEAAYNA